MRICAAALLLSACSSGAQPRDAAVVALRDAAVAAPDAAPTTITDGPRVLRDGAPIAGAEVLLWGRATALGGRPLARLTTGADGSFPLDAVPDGATWIGAFAPGAMPVVAELPRGVRAADVVLQLGACEAAYDVRVVDRRGRPIAGARLTDEYREGLAFATTDGDGRARTCYRGPVSIAAEGFGTAKPLDGSGTVTLGPERRLTGTTVPGALVEAMWYGETDDPPLYFAARADSHGRFALRGLPPGRFAVWGRRAIDGGEQLTADIDVTLGARAPAPVRVDFPALALEDIELVDVAGPVADTAFAVWTTDGSFHKLWEGVTDARGRARAPHGTIEAKRRQGLRPQAGNPARHLLRRLPSLIGRVIYDGRPIAGATISIIGEGFSGGGETDATGHFLAHSLGTGPVHVTAESWQLGVAAYRDLEIADDWNAVDFTLTAAAQVSGVVIDRAGHPMPAVQVRLLDPARASIDQIPPLAWTIDTTDAAGRFHIAGLPAVAGPLGFQVLPLGRYNDHDRYPVLDPAPVIRLSDETTTIGDVRIVVDVERVTR